MDNANEIILTVEGKKRLEDRLAELEGPEHDKIVERIKVARSFGDLSENSEYDDALEQDRKNRAEIDDIRSKLAAARVVSTGTSQRQIVEFNSTVEVTDERGKTRTYKIVGTTETDSLAGEISNESPIGAALMGHEKGDEVAFTTPSGKSRKLRIVSIG